MISTPRLFPFGSQIDDISYAGAVNGASVRPGRSSPNRVSWVFVVSNKAGADNLLINLETSPDGTNWVTAYVGLAAITADGLYTLDIDVPIMEYVRAVYSESGPDCTADVVALIFSDRTLAGAQVGPGEQTITTVGAFIVCNRAVPLDTAKSTGGNHTVYSSATTKIPASWEAAWFVSDIAGRTVGNVNTVVQFSVDEGTTWIDAFGTTALQTNGRTLMLVSVPLGGILRVKYVGAGGFDGTVTTQLLVGTRRDEARKV